MAGLDYAGRFFFYLSGDHRDLHSFPTRRSSDLGSSKRSSRRGSSSMTPLGREWVRKTEADRRGLLQLRAQRPAVHGTICFLCQQMADKYLKARSEEHTSELQSLRHLVCRLLLEK